MVMKRTDPPSPERSAPGGSKSLDGLRMRPVRTTPASIISPDTLFEFSQTENVVSARYAGGSVILGMLVGIVNGSRLTFHYAQVHQDHEAHGGRSVCDISTTPDGRLQLTERFTWDSKPGAGVNVFEAVD